MAKPGVLVPAKLKSSWLGPSRDPGCPEVGKMGEACWGVTWWRFHSSALTLLNVNLESVADSLCGFVFLYVKWHNRPILSKHQKHSFPVCLPQLEWPTAKMSCHDPRFGLHTLCGSPSYKTGDLDHQWDIVEMTWWLLRLGPQRLCDFHLACCRMTGSGSESAVILGQWRSPLPGTEASCS